MRDSKPFKISKFTNRGGSLSWRVSGSVNGKQIRRNFQSRADADAERQVLEIKRLNSSRLLRATLTALTDAQIKDCEAAIHILKDKPILEAVNFYIQNHNEHTSDKTVLDAPPSLSGT